MAFCVTVRCEKRPGMLLRLTKVLRAHELAIEFQEMQAAEGDTQVISLTCGAPPSDPDALQTALEDLLAQRDRLIS